MAHIKTAIDKKNHDRYFDRVMNQARVEQRDLNQANLLKVREERVKRDEILAAELKKVKTEDLRQLKMR